MLRWRGEKPWVGWVTHHHKDGSCFDGLLLFWSSLLGCGISKKNIETWLSNNSSRRQWWNEGECENSVKTRAYPFSWFFSEEIKMRVESTVQLDRCTDSLQNPVVGKDSKFQSPDLFFQSSSTVCFSSWGHYLFHWILPHKISTFLCVKSIDECSFRRAFRIWTQNSSISKLRWILSLVSKQHTTIADGFGWKNS